MQTLIAYRMVTESRLGNWSGTGAGKTMAAILARRVCDARLTVVVGLDSTIRHAARGWAKEIRSPFPDSRIIIKQRGDLEIDPAAHTFVLLNFEAFQQRDSAVMARRLVENHQVDMIVLDEIQCATQGARTTSKRRQTLLGLLCAARERNPELRVLGMWA
jgi:N12 class adenine-specific DNA methylase